jgi:ABC-2 type transport system permease protein
MSSIGVLVSLNAPTARAAYQRLSLVMLAVVFLPTILVNFGGETLKLFFSETFRNANLLQIGIIAGLIVLLIDGIIIWIAVQRFQRAKLILE